MRFVTPHFVDAVARGAGSVTDALRAKKRLSQEWRKRGQRPASRDRTAACPTRSCSNDRRTIRAERPLVRMRNAEMASDDPPGSQT